jgi:transposase-like protein
LASKRDWDALRRDVKPTYTADAADTASAALDDVEDTWGSRYPAIVRPWDNAWPEFIPFLDYDVEIRRVICSTNAIESLNARYRRAVRARGHFPTEQAAMKCLYLVTRSLDPTGVGRTRWTMRWKPARNAFRYHLRRPLADSRNLRMKRPEAPLLLQTPTRPGKPSGADMDLHVLINSGGGVVIGGVPCG